MYTENLFLATYELSQVKNVYTPRLVVIDDDPCFCNIMAALAKPLDVQLDYYESLVEMGSVARFADYDIAIVDYDLGQLNGVEIAEYIPALFGDMPLILVSAEQREMTPLWPQSIRKFIHKKKGAAYILKEGLLEARKSMQKSNSVMMASLTL